MIVIYILFFLIIFNSPENAMKLKICRFFSLIKKYEEYYFDLFVIAKIVVWGKQRFFYRRKYNKNKNNHINSLIFIDVKSLKDHVFIHSEFICSFFLYLCDFIHNSTFMIIHLFILKCTFNQ